MKEDKEKKSFRYYADECVIAIRRAFIRVKGCAGVLYSTDENGVGHFVGVRIALIGEVFPCHLLYDQGRWMFGGKGRGDAGGWYDMESRYGRMVAQITGIIPGTILDEDGANGGLAWTELSRLLPDRAAISRIEETMNNLPLKEGHHLFLCLGSLPMGFADKDCPAPNHPDFKILHSKPQPKKDGETVAVGENIIDLSDWKTRRGR